MNETGVLIDASSPRHFALVVKGRKVLAWRLFSADKELIEEVSLALQESGCKDSDIAFIAAGVGPGSYTGIRIAQSVACGLSLGWKVPVLPLFSMKAMRGEGVFASILDARVAGCYLWMAGMDEPIICPIESLEDYLPLGATLLTPQKERLEKRLPAGKWTLIERDPDPELLADLAICAFQEGSLVGVKQDILYLRKTEAEVGIEK